VKDDGLSDVCKVIRFRILDEWMHISCISWDVYGWMILLNLVELILDEWILMGNELDFVWLYPSPHNNRTWFSHVVIF
jgi:hypothetical protein